MWVSSEAGRSLTEITLSPRPSVVRSIAASGPVHNVLVTPGGVVAATLPAVGRLALVSGGTLTEVDLGGSPHDVEAGEGGLVVTDEGRARIELLDLRGAETGRVALRANPHNVAVSPDGMLAWVSLDGSSDLAVVDLKARAIVRYVPTELRPHDLLFAPDGRLWVTDWNGFCRSVRPKRPRAGTRPGG